MIDTLSLAKLLQDELNDNGMNKKFAIFADEGDLRKSVGKGKYKQEWTSGVLNVVSDTFENLKDLEFQTINTSLMLFVDLQSKGWTTESENTQKQSINLIEIRQVIDETIAKLTGFSRYIEDGGKRYNVTIVMNRAITGAKQGLGEVNDGIPLYLSVQFLILQNGINANDTQLKINGESVGSITSVITMQSQFDQSEFVGIGSKSYSLIDGNSFDLVLPLLESGVTAELRDSIHEKNSKRAWLVEFAYPDKSYYYICMLAKGQITISAGSNIGINVSFMEALDYLLDYSENWEVIEFVGQEMTQAEVESRFKLGDIIFWGNGVEELKEFKAHQFSSEKNTIRRFRANGL